MVDARTAQENEIIKRFPIDGKGIDSSLAIRFRILAMALVDRVPESRERACALTKLEEAWLWVNVVLARNQ